MNNGKEGRNNYMNYEMKIEHMKAFKVIGLSKEIKAENGYRECPEFWDKEYAKRYARLWQTKKPENAEEQAVIDNKIGLYGVCVMSENEKSFDYMIAGEYKGGYVPENMKVYEFPESDWVKFMGKGRIPEALQKLNDYIWNVWCVENSGKYEFNMNTDIEYYSAGNPQSEDYEFGIWFPMKKANSSDRI